MSLFNYTKKTEYGNSTNVPKLIAHIIVGVILLIGIFSSWTIVSPTEENIVIRLGTMDRTIASGFHWKLPFVENTIPMDISVQKIEVQAAAASADLQIVTTNLVLQYQLDKTAVKSTYEQYKTDVRSKVIDPAIQDSIKASTALFNADELITKRITVKDSIRNLLTDRLSEANILVRNVDIVNFDFSASFNESIERKVTAEQDALASKNKLEQVKFEAQQKIEKAKADAESIRIQAQAINSQGGADYVALQAIEKWNGILPTQMIPGGSVPFINVSK